MKKKIIADSWNLLLKGLTNVQLEEMSIFYTQIEGEMKKIIDHYLSISNSLVKVKKEFIITIPLDFNFPLRKFKKGVSYKVMFWKVEDGNTRVNNDDFWEKINSGDEWNMFGGKEGLSILRLLAPDNLPKHKQIFSFKSTKGKDVPGLTIEDNGDPVNQLIFNDRKIPIGSIIISFERI